MVRIVIIGAAGRMGRVLVRAASESPDLTLAAAVVSPGSPALGQDAGECAGMRALGIRLTSDLTSALTVADIAVDFSSALAAPSNLAACRAARKPLIVGTTGLAPEMEGAFESAAKQIPLLVAPNTSVGVTVLVELVRAAARALPPEFDIEIVEAHHRMKRDAPSGTALALGRAAAEGRQQDFEKAAVRARTGGSPRTPGEIGFASVRGGDLVGEHSVIFAGTGERVSLGHQATDRAIFARGALQAALWLAPRPAGRYFMRDIVSIKSVG